MKIKHRSLAEVAESGESMEALLFLTLGSKYLNLVHNVLDESVKSGNVHVVSSDSEDSLWEDYSRKTKWSDFMIIEPVLFNFYHGIELTLKGLLFLTSRTDFRAIHKITDHFERVDKIAEIPQDLKEIIRGHIVVNQDSNPLLHAFLIDNRISIDQLYESLRYPANKRSKDFNKYFGLHYQEARSLEYFKKLMTDIKKLQRLGGSFYRATTNTGHGGISLE